MALGRVEQHASVCIAGTLRSRVEVVAAVVVDLASQVVESPVLRGITAIAWDKAEPRRGRVGTGAHVDAANTAFGGARLQPHQVHTHACATAKPRKICARRALREGIATTGAGASDALRLRARVPYTLASGCINHPAGAPRRTGCMGATSASWFTAMTS